MARSTEDILADLYARRDHAADSGLSLPQMSYLNQQIVAHETLMRLRLERDELKREQGNTLAVDEQIRFWRNMADDDAGDAPQLHESTVLVDDGLPALSRNRRKPSSETPA